MSDKFYLKPKDHVHQDMKLSKSQFSTDHLWIEAGNSDGWESSEVHLNHVNQIRLMHYLCDKHNKTCENKGEK